MYCIVFLLSFVWDYLVPGRNQGNLGFGLHWSKGPVLSIYWCIKMWQLKATHTWSCLISANQGSEYSWTGSCALWFLLVCNQDADWGCRYLNTPPGKKFISKLTHVLAWFRLLVRGVPQFAMWVFSRGRLQYWTVCFMKARRWESEKWKSAICNLISVISPHLGFILFSREKPQGIARTPQGPEYQGVTITGGPFRSCLPPGPWNIQHCLHWIGV